MIQKLPSELELRGIDTFLDSYARVDEGSACVLCVHRSCADVGAWIAAALTLRGAPLQMFSFDHRDDALFEEVLQGKLAALRRPEIRRVVVIVCELSTMTFRRVLKRAREAEPDRVSLVRLINCSPELFELALQVTAEDLRRINAGLIDRLHRASRLRVTSPQGTDLEITLDSARYRWVSNFGLSGPGEMGILPPGELNTFPAAIRGQLVADGAFNLNLATDVDARLAGRPVRITIEDGRMVDHRCDDRAVSRLLDHVFSEEAARNVGELGFGTNVGITRFIAMNSHINERHPGVHVGFGEHGQPGLVPFQATRHLDLIFADARITVDGGEVIDMGSLSPIELPHPAGVHGEDTDAA